jgi:hypothetical protein
MSCITYINNDPNGVPVTVSGTTCGGVVGNFMVNPGQAICMDNDFEIITCGNADIGAQCLPPTTPPNTPTQTRTPSQTPTYTPTPTPSVTIGLTPTQTPQSTSTPTPTSTITSTPQVTSTPTRTPSSTPTSTPPASTPTQTPTSSPQITPSQTSTPNITPTPTSTSGETGAQLFVYAKYINNPSPGELQYSKNSGTPIVIGEISTTSCDYLYTITGLQIGDDIEFSDTSTYVIASSTTTCPSGPGGFGCSTSYSVLGTGTQYVYLTIDGSTAC